MTMTLLTPFSYDFTKLQLLIHIKQCKLLHLSIGLVLSDRVLHDCISVIIDGHTCISIGIACHEIKATCVLN